jgi:hypothetical protein
MAVGRVDYAERKEQKIHVFNERAKKATVIANQESDRARKLASVIPLGQPILIGHHSEGKHRAHLKRVDSAYHRAADAFDKAEYYEGKAATAEANQSISGDDPEALQRYEQKLAKLEKAQEFMKAVNKAWKKGKSALMALGLSEEESERLANGTNKPIPTWRLSNNNAQIRIVKEKIETIKKLDSMEAENIKFKGGEMVINVEINRVQFLFDEIPAPEIRALLKSHGFKWSPREKAWQRQRTPNGIRTAKYLIEEHFNKQ